MITKELFVKAVNELKRAHDYQEALNEFYKNNCADGYIFQPDCSETLMEVIERSMGLESDEYGNTELSKFCWDYNFGRDSKTEISTPENLYDYLTKDGDKFVDGNN